MNIIVIGCGRVGAELAGRLYEKGHKVTVVDYRADTFSNLPAEMNIRTVTGEALNRDVLHRAGIENADGIATVTSSDTLNAVVAHIARVEYNVPNIVVRNYDSRWLDLFEAFDLQVISSASWGAQRIEELLYHQQLRTVFSAGNGEVEVYEFTVPEEWDGKTLRELTPQEGCVPVALTRAGRAILLEWDTPLLFRDVVLLSASQEGIDTVRKQLKVLQGGVK